MSVCWKNRRRIIVLVVVIVVVVRATFLKKDPRLRRFKWDQGEIWQDCSSID